MTSQIRRLAVLTGLTISQVHHIVALLTDPARPGRPWALPLPARVVLCCAALRTNRTVRQLAAVFNISKSQAHRIITDLTHASPGCCPAPSMTTAGSAGR